LREVNIIGHDGERDRIVNGTARTIIRQAAKNAKINPTFSLAFLGLRGQMFFKIAGDYERLHPDELP
jgi:hypothetical protein